MKGWSLVNKDTGKIIKIGFVAKEVTPYAMVFNTKKGLLGAIDGVVEYDEVVRRVEVQEMK